MSEAPEAAATAPASEAESVHPDPGAAPQAQPQAPAAAPDQPAAQPQGAPEKYDFSLPEGYQADPAVMDKFQGIARELNLTQEQAQKLVALDAERLAASGEAQKAQFAQQVEAWVGELKNDQTFGGANFDGNVKVAQKAMADFGTPELKQMLETSGLGSHPEVVRLFHRIGQQLGEGAVHRTTSDVPAETSWAQRMYPDMKS